MEPEAPIEREDWPEQAGLEQAGTPVVPAPRRPPATQPQATRFPTAVSTLKFFSICPSGSPQVTKIPEQITKSSRPAPQSILPTRVFPASRQHPLSSSSAAPRPARRRQSFAPRAPDPGAPASSPRSKLRQLDSPHFYPQSAARTRVPAQTWTFFRDEYSRWPPPPGRPAAPHP